MKKPIIAGNHPARVNLEKGQEYYFWNKWGQMKLFNKWDQMKLLLGLAISVMHLEKTSR